MLMEINGLAVFFLLGLIVAAIAALVAAEISLRAHLAILKLELDDLREEQQEMLLKQAEGRRNTRRRS